MMRKLVALLATHMYVVLIGGCTLTAHPALTPKIAEESERGIVEKSMAHPKWRVARSTFYLAPTSSNTEAATFRFSSIGAERSEIIPVLRDAPSGAVELACDGPFAVQAPGMIAKRSDGSQVTFVLTGDIEGRTNALIVPDGGTNSCDMHVRFANRSRTYRLLREEQSYPLLAEIDLEHEDCADQSSKGRTELERAFLAKDGLSQTCSLAHGRVDLLEDPVKSFNFRVAALLGKPLSSAFIEKGNPYAPIDMRLAPKLDLIVISALDFKADFSGTVIGRLIRYHASRGTPVRIMASTILERRKDRLALERLSGEFPNVELRLFDYKPDNILDPSEHLAAAHRVHHVKLFAALSPVRGKSVAILGGRNIHDGFLYKKPLDFRAFPRLHTYPGQGAPTLNYYTNWHDFDLAFHDTDVVRQLIAHFSQVWNSDSRTHALRTAPEQVRSAKVFAPLRHFISVPYKDAHALETHYVRLIDAARERIEIVNPYLNPTPALKAAFDRAIARGVKLEIIGRIDMRGDLGGEMLTAVNEKFVSDNYNSMAIRDYRADGVVLHSKIMLIDAQLSIISSVNLNNRSFLHDSENGVIILDRDFYRRMEPVLQRYRAQSDLVRSAGGWSAYQLLLLSRTVRQTF